MAVGGDGGADHGVEVATRKLFRPEFFRIISAPAGILASEQLTHKKALLQEDIV